MGGDGAGTVLGHHTNYVSLHACVSHVSVVYPLLQRQGLLEQCCNDDNVGHCHDEGKESWELEGLKGVSVEGVAQDGEEGANGGAEDEAQREGDTNQGLRR